MPVSSIAGIRPLIDASCLPNTNRRRRAWNRFIYLSRSCLSIVIVSKDILSRLRKKSEIPKFEGLLGEFKKLQYYKTPCQSSNSLMIAFDRGLVAQKRRWSIWGKNRPFASRDSSQCVSCDHSQESAVNVILLQNFSGNSLIIIAFLFCKHWLRLCQLWKQNVDESNRAHTSKMLLEKTGQNGPPLVFFGRIKNSPSTFFSTSLKNLPQVWWCSIVSDITEYNIFNSISPSTSYHWNSFWENVFLARDLEVLKSIYLFRVDVSDQQGPSSEHH